MTMEVIREELLQCSICMEMFKDPRGLPCQHTYCCDCLSTYIKAKRNSSSPLSKSFDCPLCRRKVLLDNFSDNGESFPKNLIVTSLLDIHMSGKSKHRSNTSSSMDMLHPSQPPKVTTARYTQTQMVKYKEEGAQTVRQAKKTRMTQTKDVLIATSGTQTEEHSNKKRRDTQSNWKDNSRGLEKENKETQTEHTLAGNDLLLLHVFLLLQPIQNLQYIVFLRKFISPIERLAIRCTLANDNDLCARNGPKSKFGNVIVKLYSYVCCVVYVVFVLYLCFGENRQRYVFMIILMFTFVYQALTIILRADFQDIANLKRIVMFHVVYCCTTFFLLFIIVYSLCLLISIRGHPKLRTVCETRFQTRKLCRFDPIEYPDASFIRDRTKDAFSVHLSRMCDLDFSRIVVLANELYDHVILGKAIMFKDEIEVYETMRFLDRKWLHDSYTRLS